MREIQVFGSAVLRRTAREVDATADAEVLADLLKDMSRLLALEEGLGLAAPQAGESLRVFMLEATSLPAVCGRRVFVNPVLEPSGPLCRREEGCLSLPGIYEDVTRPSRVTISALDHRGEPFRLELEGLAARVVQHENDHLDGVLFIDRIGALRRRLLKGRLDRLAAGA